MRTLFFLFASALPASAHLGHVGEVAGHSHWIAVGAGVAIAAIGAWIGKRKLDAEADKENGETSEAGAEPEGHAEGQAA